MSLQILPMGMTEMYYLRPTLKNGLNLSQLLPGQAVRRVNARNLSGGVSCETVVQKDVGKPWGGAIYACTHIQNDSCAKGMSIVYAIGFNTPVTINQLFYARTEQATPEFRE